MFHNRHMRRHPEMYGITFVNETEDDASGGGLATHWRARGRLLVRSFAAASGHASA